MDKTNGLCDEVKLAISSGEPLTDAQKNHLENCPECRTFQNELLKLTSDLSSLSVPNIGEGQIADAVMERIHSEKKVKFPKFRLQNHIGTAAAILIVIAIFATNRGSRLLNNISDKSTAENSVTTTERAPETTITNSAPPSKKEDSDTGNVQIMPNALAATGAEVPESTDEAAPKLRSSVTDESAEQESSTPSVKGSAPEKTENEMQVNTADTPYSSDSLSVEPDNSTDLSVAESKISSNKSESPEEKSSFEETPETAPPMNFAFTAQAASEKASPASGGSSDYPDEYGNENNYDLTDEGVSIFEGIDFGTDFQENVSLANAKVKENFAEAEQLNCEMLINNGFTNEDFILWAKTVYNESQYSFESFYEYTK